jgi:hypothetical protein
MENRRLAWTANQKNGILHASSPFLNAAVAQWIEYWPPKPRVVGSIPASRTIKSGTYTRQAVLLHSLVTPAATAIA